MIIQAGITVAHDPMRSTTTLTDSNRNWSFELDYGGYSANPEMVERTMFRAYFLGGTRGLLGCFGAEHIRRY